MPRVLTDREIADLISEGKPLPKNWPTRLKLKPKMDTRYAQRDLEIEGEGGHRFCVVLRRNLTNLLDFSVILKLIDSDQTEYILLRYNGRHPSNHTNPIEKKRGLANAVFRNQFHIHRATEHYQIEYGHKSIEKYAEVTDQYSSYDAALAQFIHGNGFLVPSENSAGQTAIVFDTGDSIHDSQ